MKLASMQLPRVREIPQYVMNAWGDLAESLPRIPAALKGESSPAYDGQAEQTDTSGLSRLLMLLVALGATGVDMLFAGWSQDIFGLNAWLLIIRVPAAFILGFAVINRLAEMDRSQKMFLDRIQRPSLGWLAQTSNSETVTPLCEEWTEKEVPTFVRVLRLSTGLAGAFGIVLLPVAPTLAGISLAIAALSGIVEVGLSYTSRKGGSSINQAAKHDLEQSLKGGWHADDNDSDDPYGVPDSYDMYDLYDVDKGDSPPSSPDSESDEDDESEPSALHDALYAEGTPGLPSDLISAVGVAVAIGLLLSKLASLGIPFAPAAGLGLTVGVLVGRYLWGARHPAYLDWFEGLSQQESFAGVQMSLYPQSAEWAQATRAAPLDKESRVLSAVFTYSGSSNTPGEFLGPVAQQKFGTALGAELFAFCPLAAQSESGQVDAGTGSLFAYMMLWSPSETPADAWLDPDEDPQIRGAAIQHLFQAKRDLLPKKERPIIEDPQPMFADGGAIVLPIFTMRVRTPHPPAVWRKSLPSLAQILNVEWISVMRSERDANEIKLMWSKTMPQGKHGSPPLVDPTDRSQTGAFKQVMQARYTNAFAASGVSNDSGDTPTLSEIQYNNLTGVQTCVFDLNGIDVSNILEPATTDAIAAHLGFTFIRPGEPIKETYIDADGVKQTQSVPTSIRLLGGIMDPLQRLYSYSDGNMHDILTDLQGKRDKTTADKLISRWSPGITSNGDRLWSNQIAQPHGVLAGTTGSGKTQILRGWYLQPAFVNPPSLLKFFLIDAGLEAQFFSELPHMIGLLTQGTVADGIPFQVAGLWMLQTLKGLHEARLKTLAAHPMTPPNAGAGRAFALSEVDHYVAGTVPSYWEDHWGAFPWWDTDEDHPLWMPVIYTLIEEFPSFTEKGNTAETKAASAEILDIVATMSTIARKTGIHILMTAQRPTKDDIPPKFRDNSTLASMFVANIAAARYVGDEKLSLADNPSITPGQGIQVGVSGVPQWFKGYYDDDDYFQALIDLAADMWGGSTKRDARWWKNRLIVPEIAKYAPGPCPGAQPDDDDDNDGQMATAIPDLFG